MSRLNLNMDNIDKLSEDELKREVDAAVGNLVTPLKMKSHLINQLKTQIEDLEMYIEFLQGETSTITPGSNVENPPRSCQLIVLIWITGDCNDCACSKHGQSKSVVSGDTTKNSSNKTRQFTQRTRLEQVKITA